MTSERVIDMLVEKGIERGRALEILNQNTVDDEYNDDGVIRMVLDFVPKYFTCHVCNKHKQYKMGRVSDVKVYDVDMNYKYTICRTCAVSGRQKADVS